MTCEYKDRDVLSVRKNIPETGNNKSPVRGSQEWEHCVPCRILQSRLTVIHVRGDGSTRVPRGGQAAGLGLKIEAGCPEFLSI